MTAKPERKAKKRVELTARRAAKAVAKVQKIASHQLRHRDRRDEKGAWETFNAAVKEHEKARTQFDKAMGELGKQWRRKYRLGPKKKRRGRRL